MVTLIMAVTVVIHCHFMIMIIIWGYRPILLVILTGPRIH